MVTEGPAIGHVAEYSLAEKKTVNVTLKDAVGEFKLARRT